MTMQSVRDALAKNRRDAIAISSKVGVDRMKRELADAQKDLEARLARLPPGIKGTFSEHQMKAALYQVRHVIRGLRPGMKDALVDTALEAADTASANVVDYLGKADAQFRGVGSTPLALDEASMLDSARSGARSTILRRIGTSGEDVPGAEEVPHMAKVGVLDRYGMNVIGDFEKELRIGLTTRKSFDEMRDAITEKSPFLQGKPAFWAERIVRTEVMGAYNKASFEAVSDADDQLGDMVKILSATFDDRTAADSYAVHGQIRRPDEPFDTWTGQMQHPPARPNDREIVVPHRVSWPIPAYLIPRKPAEVLAKWNEEKHSKKMPAIPPDTTVPREQFGLKKPPKVGPGRKGTPPDIANE